MIGKLGDQHGKERMLVVSLGIFLLGSLGAIFAWNIWALIACRIVQGAGGAVFPLSFAIIKDEFPEEKIGVALGAVSAAFAVGGSLGLVLSGVIVDNLSWRWLFAFGAVPVAVALLLVHRFVPESPVKTPSRLDVPGVALLSGGLVSLLVALTEGSRWGWGSTLIVALFAAAGVLLVVWVLVERRVAEPMVDMRMLARRPVLFTNLTGLVTGFAMFGTFVLVPKFVEMPSGCRRRSPARSTTASARASPRRGSTCCPDRSSGSSPARWQACSGGGPARRCRCRSGWPSAPSAW